MMKFIPELETATQEGTKTLTSSHLWQAYLRKMQSVCKDEASNHATAINY